MESLGQQLKVGIVGGGYAGFAAAVSLAERGVPVSVFESAPQLGGRARGVSYRDAQLDNGQHLLLGCYRETLRLIELVGGNIRADFLSTPMQLDLYHEFSLRAPRLPAPLHLLVGLLTAQGLSFSSRLRAIRFMASSQRRNFRLDRDISVAELLARHNQDADLVAKLWEPLCIAALNTPVAKASAQVMLHVLRDSMSGSRSASDMLLPRIDFSALFPDRAATYVAQRGGSVRVSCGVSALQLLDTGIQLVTGDGVEQFDYVICATSPTVAGNLLRPIGELANIIAMLDRIEHQPIFTVYLQYPPDVKLPSAMLGLRNRHSQWLFDKGAIGRQHGLLAVVISAEGLHQNLSHDELAQEIAAELQVELGIADAPMWTKVIAEKRATFCCSPDMARPSQSTPISALLLAGDYTAGDYPATLEGAVLSGLKCARLICERSYI
jgi:squalene-associated FAD-dependent desaturase